MSNLGNDKNSSAIFEKKKKREREKRGGLKWQEKC